MRSSRLTKMWIMLFVGFVVLTTFSGCSTKHTDYSAFVQEPRPLVTATEYRMAPPDVVMVMSKRVREINNQSQQIRPDGMIVLPLVGSVFVAGKTSEEVGFELQAMATEFYEDADVTVRVVGFNSKKIFVFGEVGRAGPYPYNGTNTVLETLAFAQPTRLSDPQNIQVLRPNSEGEMIKRMTIDLDEMVKKGDLTLDAVLEEGDILYVPANALASVGLAFQQLLLPIQPAATTVQAPVNFETSFNSAPYKSQASGN